MGKRNPELRQVSFWVDEEERDALQQLCKTRGESVSDAFRKWITASLDVMTWGWSKDIYRVETAIVINIVIFNTLFIRLWPYLNCSY